jgi:hypothetical protein
MSVSVEPGMHDVDGDAARPVSTVQFGMSVQARDGATREELSAVVDRAMAALGPLTCPAA